MKTIAFILSMIAVAGTGVVAQKQTTSPLKQPKQILHDFRVPQTSDTPKIPLATQRNVLSKVFRRYLTDESKCNPQFDASSDTDPLKAARNAGQIVPSILDSATGSFTTAGRPETLYVISVSECNASHADNFGTKRVAIFAGQQLIANVDSDFKSSIVAKTDLNGDDLDELLMMGGDMNQGILIEIAALIEFHNGRLRVVEDLGTVMEDACASGIAGSTSRASVVSFSDAAPGKMPRLRIENYETSCRRAKRWRLVSTGKMQG
jgi:hypothetical protein